MPCRKELKWRAMRPPNANVSGFTLHNKRRLLTLCSDEMKLRNFLKQSGLSNDRCPRNMSIFHSSETPHSCVAVYGRIVHLSFYRCIIFTEERVYSYISVGFALSVLLFRAMRRPHFVERRRSDSTFFLSICCRHCSVGRRK